ncbi:MAG: SBBP repeat-containing protein [Candidatus Schekmanbacteria bacterium]|nr:SBBP repeat-containing protein [Candidatus Schekmanbacteria bacterium]
MIVLAGGAALVPTHAVPESACWTRQSGTAANEFARAAVTDEAGNIFVAGMSYGDFAGQGNSGDRDYLVAGYDRNGEPSWARLSGTAAFDHAQAIAINASGDLLIAGQTQGDLESQTNQGGFDAFLVKLDSAGNHRWTRLLGSGGGETGHAVAADSSGNSYLVGWTNGSLDGQPTAGGNDIFVSRHDSAGIKEWTRLLGTSRDDVAYGAACDGTGNVYVAGASSGALGGASSGGADIVLAKWDSSGANLWTRQWGTAGEDVAISVAVAADGTIFVSGNTDANLEGESSGGAIDAFLAKVTPAGERIWTRLLGGTGNDFGYSVAAGREGNVYLAGYTDGDLDGMTSSGGYDFLVARFDAGGGKLWSELVGTGEADNGYAVAVDRDLAVTVVGATRGSLNGQTHLGGQDVLVRHYCAPGVTPTPTATPVPLLVPIGGGGWAALFLIPALLASSRRLQRWRR